MQRRSWVATQWYEGEKCKICTFERSNWRFPANYARNEVHFVHYLQNIGDGATLTPWLDIAPRFLILQAPASEISSTWLTPTTSGSSDCNSRTSSASTKMSRSQHR